MLISKPQSRFGASLQFTPPAVPSQPILCDIFCTVIDNLGDAGVCWRLARQLAREHDWRIRLWIDNPAPIARIAPDQQLVEVCHWLGDFEDVESADVVIESFACDLPPRYIEAMKGRRPVWINLEYLSAEDWVAGCHGLPSPQHGLQKFFFFPGFVSGTGGLLREGDYAVLPASTFVDTLEISLFCYTNPALPELLIAWRDGTTDVVCHVADGLPRQQVESWLGTPFETVSTVKRGHLTLHALPFLPQDDYDRLLGRCHVNFVRGEDSFVRAQWAERAFVWQIYPQSDAAHFTKLQAFLDLYEKVDAGETALRAFWFAWNGRGKLNWPEFAATLPVQTRRATAWSSDISTHGDLAMNLVKFCASRL